MSNYVGFLDALILHFKTFITHRMQRNCDFTWSSWLVTSSQMTDLPKTSPAETLLAHYVVPLIPLSMSSSRVKPQTLSGAGWSLTCWMLLQVSNLPVRSWMITLPQFILDCTSINLPDIYRITAFQHITSEILKFFVYHGIGALELVMRRPACSNYCKWRRLYSQPLVILHNPYPYTVSYPVNLPRRLKLRVK